MTVRTVLFFFSLFFLAVAVTAQNQDSVAPANTKDTSESEWQLEGLLYDYILPHEGDILMPILYVDWRSFHAEVRYNYEDMRTASVFAGYRLEAGEKLAFGATPMVGILFGNSSGLAPGLLLDLAYGKFDFYSESEYIVDFSGSENNYFYTWTELAFTPLENIRTGISANRTRLYQAELDVQKGLFAQCTFGKSTAGFHYFNPFTEDYFFVASLGFEF
jgi:hypothetical protein